MEDFNQLIVVGNGFDLQCGLESSFLNFKKDRYRDRRIGSERVAPQTYLQFIEENMDKYTLWDAILGRACDLREGTEGYRESGFRFIEDWYDVEQTINSWFLDSGNDSYDGFLRYHDIQSRMGELLRIGIQWIGGQNLSQVLHEAYIKRLHDYAYDNIINTSLENTSSFPSDYLSGGLDDILQKVLIEVFLYELRSFEKEFGVYLQKIVDVHDDYEDRACHLLRCLAKIGAEKNVNINNYLFNFNYTNPFSSLPEDELRGQCHIHGMVDVDRERTNLIFGVDGYGVGQESRVYHFTKARRRADLLFGNESSFMGIYRKKIDAIKVYGHSLNKADYSYFHSWFDRTRLYDGSVKLYFIGTSEHQPDRDAVIALLEQYATTISARSQGDNLLSRLIMEDRLIFTNIE